MDRVQQLRLVVVKQDYVKERMKKNIYKNFKIYFAIITSLFPFDLTEAVNNYM